MLVEIFGFGCNSLNSQYQYQYMHNPTALFLLLASRDPSLALQSHLLQRSPPELGKVCARSSFRLAICKASKSQNARAENSVHEKKSSEIPLVGSPTVPPRSSKHEVESFPVGPTIEMVSLGHQDFLLILLCVDDDGVDRAELHLKYRSVDLEQRVSIECK